MAAILDLDFARDQAAKLTRGVPFHADCIEPVKVTIPKNLKALPDLSAMVIEYGKFMRARSDEAFFEPIQEEIERLQCAEYDRDQILEASTGLLLLLSRLEGTIRNMGPEAGEALDKYVAAVREAQA